MAPATGFEPATCPLTAVTFLSPARPGQTLKLKSGAGMLYVQAVCSTSELWAPTMVDPAGLEPATR